MLGVSASTKVSAARRDGEPRHVRVIPASRAVPVSALAERWCGRFRDGRTHGSSRPPLEATLGAE